jgi:hypothetical protein
VVLRRAAQQTAAPGGPPRPYQVVLFGHSDAAGLALLNTLACAAMDCVSRVFLYTEGCPTVLSDEARQVFETKKEMLQAVHMVHYKVRPLHPPPAIPPRRV